MPQWGNQDYKSAVFEQLAKGSGSDAQETDHFEHFSTRRPFHPTRWSRSSATRPQKSSRRSARR